MAPGGRSEKALLIKIAPPPQSPTAELLAKRGLPGIRSIKKITSDARGQSLREAGKTQGFLLEKSSPELETRCPK